MYDLSFPSSLKKLTLKNCHLPWREMSKIQCLPKLEVLKLLDGAFYKWLWDFGELPFQQLKYLKMEGLDIVWWEASSINFPSLKQLAVLTCYDLTEIPLDIGYIPTLEYIEIDESSSLVMDSVERIQEEQHADGNFDLNITRNREIYRDRIQFLLERYKINSVLWVDCPPVFPTRRYPKNNRNLDVQRSKRHYPNNNRNSDVRRSKHHLIRPKF